MSDEEDISVFETRGSNTIIRELIDSDNDSEDDASEFVLKSKQQVRIVVYNVIVKLIDC